MVSVNGLFVWIEVMVLGTYEDIARTVRDRLVGEGYVSLYMDNANLVCQILMHFLLSETAVRRRADD